NGCMSVVGTPEVGTYGKHFCIATLRAYVVINSNVTYFETKDTLVLVVNSKNGNNGIDNQLSKSVTLHTYPTPFDNQLQLEISSTIASPISIELMNISGQAITSQQSKITPGTSKFEFNTEQLPQGFYLLRISTQEGSQTVKILK
ncbi:MAG: T9SS type A sorting domain-containing protein, partial [Bacteroidetes bacterium]|nr:T9SS type A sorting domain-containing protein [Bacteroidota bacterium]